MLSWEIYQQICWYPDLVYLPGMIILQHEELPFRAAPLYEVDTGISIATYDRGYITREFQHYVFLLQMVQGTSPDLFELNLLACATTYLDPVSSVTKAKKVLRERGKVFQYISSPGLEEHPDKSTTFADFGLNNNFLIACYQEHPGIVVTYSGENDYEALAGILFPAKGSQIKDMVKVPARSVGGFAYTKAFLGIRITG